MDYKTRNTPAIICPATPRSISRSENHGERYRVSLNGVNVANRRVLLDNSLTFGGFHFNDPRQIYLEFRWKFHY